MDYRDDKSGFWSIRRKFYDQRKEVELMDDCVAEALTKRAVPITIITSVATYMAIRNGFLRNNGMFGLLAKNFMCMCIGVGASLIDIRSNYYDKLAIFYSSHRYQELRNMILDDWASKKSEKQNSNPFVKPNHLNLDLERPHFNGIDANRSSETNRNSKHEHPQNYVTYEELQRKNREQYAIKHTVYS